MKMFSLRSVGLARSFAEVFWRPVRHFCDNPHANETVLSTVTPILTTGDRGVNQVTLIGRIGSQPEIRGTPERPVAVMSLATTQTFRRGDGIFYNKTQWHRVAVFRPSFVNKVVPKIKTGDKVYVAGKLEYSNYSTKEGESVKTATVIADGDLFVLGGSSKSSSQETSPEEEHEEGTESKT